jgi:hypothetical protein
LTCTGSFLIGPTTTTPQSVSLGETATVVAEICSGSVASSILIDLEVYGPSGQKVAQKVFKDQTFMVGETKTYTWPYAVPVTRPPGNYTVRIGVFSNDWATLFAWDSQTGGFTVQPGTSTACGAGVTIGPTALAPIAVVAGAGEPVRIYSHVCSSATNAIVDLEIYDSTGSKVAQASMPLPAGESHALSWAYTVRDDSPAGTYTVRLGVFSADWTILYQWDSQAATFEVEPAGSPPPALCTGGVAIGPTFTAPTRVSRADPRILIETYTCAGTAASDLITWVEIYEPDGRRAVGFVAGRDSFAAGEQTRYSSIFTFLSAPGLYVVKVGVFSGDWSTLHQWDNRAGTFVIVP